MKESKIKDSRDLKSLKRFSRFRKLQCLKRDTSMQHHAISCNSDQSREDANQQQAPVQGGSIQLDLAKTPDLRLQPDLSFLANVTGSKATNTHCGMRFLLAAWHRWGVAQAGPAAIRMNLEERGFCKPMHQRQLSIINTVHMLHRLPSTPQGSQLQRSPQCCQ